MAASWIANATSLLIRVIFESHCAAEESKCGNLLRCVNLACRTTGGNPKQLLPLWGNKSAKHLAPEDEGDWSALANYQILIPVIIYVCSVKVAAKRWFYGTLLSSLFSWLQSPQSDSNIEIDTQFNETGDADWQCLDANRKVCRAVY